MSSAATIISDVFGQTKDGLKVTRYTLSNSKGVNVKILDYGGIITEINVPDKNGTYGDVTLGFDSVKEYEEKSRYFGALIGRVANRIANGQFTLDGETYKLFVNNGPNSLHGGQIGFDKKIWKATVQDNKLVITYVSADGEENYPGEVTVTVIYSLDEANALTIDYTASSTKATPINLTNHAYFNLGGHDCGTINDSVITIFADSYLPLDENSIPTGEIKNVAGTEFDLGSPVRLGDRLSLVRNGTGFDTNFCLDNNGTLKLAVRLEHPPSGRYMECQTTEPGMQFYTSYYLADMTGKGGASYGRFGALCLEAQHYPDSVHQTSFPNTILRPGEIYKQKTIYTFGIV